MHFVDSVQNIFSSNGKIFQFHEVLLKYINGQSLKEKNQDHQTPRCVKESMAAICFVPKVSHKS